MQLTLTYYPKAKGGWVPRLFTRTQKLLILRRAGYKCQLCGESLTKENFEADHRIAYTLGGPTEVWNALALCGNCNRCKSDKPIDNVDG